MSPRTPMNEGELLAQVGWVRALARRLAQDAHEADDLAQDALVVAMSGPRPADGSLRQWLAGVLRGVWYTRRRAERRRGQREDAACREDSWPSASDLVQRAASQRAITALMATRVR